MLALNISLSHSRSTHSKCHPLVGRVKSVLLSFPFMCISFSYHFLDIPRQIMARTWNMGRDRSRSLKMAPFDRSYTTYYWSAIVSIAPFASYLTSKSGSGSLKMVPIESLGTVSHSHSIVTISDIARYWSKIVIFHTPMHSSPCPACGEQEETSLHFLGEFYANMQIRYSIFWAHPELHKVEPSTLLRFATATKRFS